MLNGTVGGGVVFFFMLLSSFLLSFVAVLLLKACYTVFNGLLFINNGGWNSGGWIEIREALGWVSFKAALVACGALRGNGVFFLVVYFFFLLIFLSFF